ncbi:uroporphyrinogen-III C-methyltransferase [Thalassotalea litorea]|uniref:uroporphyrinogen-III C-methyltransferase n=1 Tax=Thalassotalea litorea TaxID=2020715 RepID=UPI00373626EA
MTEKDKKTQDSTAKDGSTPSTTKTNQAQASGKDSPQKTSGHSTKVNAADAAKIAAQAKAQAKPSASADKSKQGSPGNQSQPSGESKARSASSSVTSPRKAGRSSSGSSKETIQSKSSSEKSTGVSKTGLLALLVALAAAGGVGGLYYYQQQQLQALTERLNDKIESEQQTNSQRMSQDVEAQIDALKQASQQNNRELANQLTDKNDQQQQALLQQVEQLEGKISRITAQQPSNWRVYEAEYLLRMAARVIWLEHDVNTALSLLNDADARLASMKQSRFLPIRKLIREDMQMLNQLPQDKSQDIILALLALSDSTDSLVIKGADKKVEVPPQEQELSDDISDWERNLRISWERFVADFIRVRDKNDQDEPLMAPQYQQHLLQNLQLKLQISQWAVTQQEQQLYQKSLDDVEQWLDKYFAKNNDANKAFVSEISNLKAEEIAIDYPQNLRSQQALREMLDQNFSASTRTTSDSEKPTTAASKSEQQDTTTSPDDKAGEQ